MLQQSASSFTHLDVTCLVAVTVSTAFKEARYPEAVQHYQEALKRGPPSVNSDAHKLYSNLAACYTKLGAYPEGLKAAEK